MNTCDDTSFEKTLDNISDQISHLLLDLLLVSVHKARSESNLILDLVEPEPKNHFKTVPF